MGELADFRFDVKYRKGKANIDADTLPRLPFDIDSYVDSCTQELPRDTSLATWEGSRVAKQRDFAYVAVLNLPQHDSTMQSPDLLPTVSHDELMKSLSSD